jgi:hypothetical protein
MMDPQPPCLVADYYDYTIRASMIDLIHFLSDVMLNRPADLAMMTMDETLVREGNYVVFNFTSNWDYEKMVYEMEYHGHIAVLAGFKQRINNVGN